MKVKTRVQAGYGAVRGDGTKCRHEPTRGGCTDCCIDRNRKKFGEDAVGDICQAGCGRFFKEA